jgi:hypothetical protein
MFELGLYRTAHRQISGLRVSEVGIRAVGPAGRARRTVAQMKHFGALWGRGNETRFDHSGEGQHNFLLWSSGARRDRGVGEKLPGLQHLRYQPTGQTE